MKIGILGLGSIGTRHARNLTDLGHEMLVYDPAYPAEMGCGLSRDQIIAHADALVIATPTVCHYRDLIDCMGNGKKPVFVEKPIAASADAWSDLHNYLCTKKVFVGYNLRFHRCVDMAREWLDTDAIGTPVAASFVCAQFNGKYNDPLVLNWSHEIDLARHLLGPCRVVSAWMPGPECANLVLEHERGMRSSIHLNYITTPQVRRFQIVGTGGAISVDLVNQTFEAATASALRDRHFLLSDSMARCYVAEMQAFLAHIAGNQTVGAGGDDGLAVLKLCLDAQEMAA